MAKQALTLPDRLMPDTEVALMLGVSRGWPWKLVALGDFPQPIKLSTQCTRWRLSDVQAWMADPEAWKAANRKAVAA